MVARLPKVLLFINPERASGKLMITGIAKYIQVYGPWIFCKKIPYYEKGFSMYKRPLDSHEGQEMIAKIIRSGAVQGFIGAISDKRMAKRLLPEGFPAVVIPTYELIPGYVNLSETETIGEKAAEHLLDKGFKEFAFCGYEKNYWSAIRRDSFCDYLRKAGYEPHVYERSDKSMSPEWKQEHYGLLTWLKNLPKPLGIWVWNDEMASVVVEACHILNIIIPDEAAILGTDNDELVCHLSVPSTSSLLLNFEEAGYEIAESLHKQMLGQSVKSNNISVAPLHVVERQSTDIQAIEDPCVAKAVRFIHNNANRLIQVDDVVNESCLSRRNLYNRFNKIVGRSIYKEIERVRTEAIAKALISTDTSISEIALRFGFSSEAHISRFFKKIKGMTPGQYRRKHRPAS